MHEKKRIAVFGAGGIEGTKTKNPTKIKKIKK